MNIFNVWKAFRNNSVWIKVLNLTQPSDSVTLVHILSVFARWLFLILFSHGILSFTNNYSSLCCWLCFIFLMHWESGTNQKLTSKSSHHEKYQLPSFPSTPQKVPTYFSDNMLYTFSSVTLDELFGLCAKANSYTRV